MRIIRSTALAAVSAAIIATAMTLASAAPATAQAPSAAAPTTDARLVVTEHTTYTSQYSTALTVVGIIENQSTDPFGARDVRTIAVSLLGEDGATVAAGSAIHKPTKLFPGQKAGFYAHVPEGKNHPGAKLRIQVEASSVSPYMHTSHNVQVEGLTISAPTQFGMRKVTGQLVNIGPTDLESVKVLIALYDGSGKLVDVVHDFATLKTMASGQSSPFDASVSSRVTGPLEARVVYAEARIVPGTHAR